MVRKFSNEDNSRRLLLGNDTDVSECIITRYGDDFLIVDIMIDDDSNKIYPKARVENREEFKKSFDMQYGSPMNYISKEDYDWITQ